jgi:hypothetical protein
MIRVRIVVLTVAIVSCAALGNASAQSPGRGIEVGAQFAVLRLADFGSTNAGIGGRASIVLSRWLAIEGEVSVFPYDNLTVSQNALPQGPRVVYHRRRGDAFFGAKLGYRGSHAGVFAKVRPGFARLSDTGVECVGQICALMLLALPEYRTEFALDYGGVFEVYPSPRLTARFDLGGVMIRHRSLAPPCRSCDTQNFASRVGIGIRF